MIVVNLKRVKRLMKKTGHRGLCPPRKKAAFMDRGYSNLVKTISIKGPKNTYGQG